MLWLKAFHIVFVIAWMAGLFYIYRLYVYHAMEEHTVVQERLIVMERRVLRAIAAPAALLVLATGIAQVALYPAFLSERWLWEKLGLVAGLLMLHGYAIKVAPRMAENPQRYSHKVMRFLNEVPTLLMIGIVVLTVVKP